MDSKLLELLVDSNRVPSISTITATRKLARELRKTCNTIHRERGDVVWPSAEILPFEAWTRRWWQQSGHMAKAGQPEVLLSDMQCTAIWHRIVADYIAHAHHQVEPLWSVPSTAASAFAAWRRCHQWHIDIGQIAASFSPDHRIFATWAQSFEQECRRNQWIDPYRMVDRLIGRLEPNQNSARTIVFAGFDPFTPQQQALIEKLGQCGYTVIVDPEPADRVDITVPEPAEYRLYENEYRQWLGAAYWARDWLGHNPQAKIALVAPDLRKSRPTIEHALDQVLRPIGIQDGSGTRPYHLSLGQPLSQIAMVRTALRLIALCMGKTFSNQHMLELVQSPHIAQADQESNSRAALETWCRRRVPFEISLTSFRRLLENSKSAPQPPLLLEMFQQILQGNVNSDARQSYRFWAEQFMQWLQCFGWPGDRALDSEQYQVVAATREKILDMATLDSVSSPVDVDSALATLKQKLDEQPFEAEQVGTQIEVLGTLETAGLEFDAIWFGNMNDGEWPPALQSEPFIPAKLLRDSGFPRTEPESNNRLAARQLQRLIDRSGNAVFSRYRMERDVECLAGTQFPRDLIEETHHPSTLLEQLPVAETLEAFEDQIGLEFSASAAAGGSGLITDQSACPFKAYAKYRLGAQEDELHPPGLDAAERGALVHSILERAWQQIGSSRALHALEPGQLDEILNHFIEQSSHRYRMTSGYGDRFFNLQSQWLLELLRQWFELEKLRGQEFDIQHLEKKLAFTLGPLQLNLKIDRIDRLGDGSLAMIDYKTGTADAISNWIGERPSAPQLPLYLLAQLGDVSEQTLREVTALAIAQVRSGQCKFQGVSKDEYAQDKYPSRIAIDALETSSLKEFAEDWEELVGHWHQTLTDLAEQFGGGEAGVDPLDGACKFCDLGGLCRISERSKPESVPGEDQDD